MKPPLAGPGLSLRSARTVEGLAGLAFAAARARLAARVRASAEAAGAVAELDRARLGQAPPGSLAEARALARWQAWAREERARRTAALEAARAAEAAERARTARAFGRSEAAGLLRGAAEAATRLAAERKAEAEAAPVKPLLTDGS